MTNIIGAVQPGNLMDAVRQITRAQGSMESFAAGATGGTEAAKGAPSFGDMLSSLVKSVDKTNKTAAVDATSVMTGKSDNIHQAMLSMQESSLSLTMMSEVRNKLVSAYQELMRMQV